MEDAYANQSSEVPRAILEDSRGDVAPAESGAGQGQEEQNTTEVGEEAGHHQQQPETFGDRPDGGGGAEVQY